MKAICAWFMRLTGLFGGARRDRELTDELESHLQLHIEDSLRQGPTPAAARRTALIKLGGMEQTKERYRDRRGIPRLETLAQDLRSGLRMMRKSPGFTAIAVATLALGIGANTAIFSLVNAVLVKPLPYPHPEQLVNVWRTQGSGWIGSVSIPDLRDWEEENKVFDGISAFSTARFNLRPASEPETAEGAYVSANLFDVMQVAPLAGRGFEEGEDASGRNDVVALGYDIWINEFGGDPGVVGRDITLNGSTYNVVAVMPEGFHYPSFVTKLWVPLALDPSELRRDAHDFRTVARLKPGVSIEHARTDLNVISARLAKEYPDTDRGLGALLVPLKTAAVQRVQQSLLIAFAAVGLIFLIACANVSTFLLSSAAARQREVALRVALGASRIRLVQQFLIEGLLLAISGSILAALTAHWSVSAIVGLAGRYFFDPGAIRPDRAVFGFTLALAIVAGLLVSVAVAWSATRVDMNEPLKESAQTMAGSRTVIRSQRLLVIAQVSAAFLLLIGAGTMIESLRELSRINPGFDPDHVLTMRIPLSSAKYAAGPISLTLEPMLSRITGLPGVQSAGVITYLPMQSYGTTSGFQIQGKSSSVAGEEPWAEVRAVSPGYHRVMGIGLLRGRLLTQADSAAAPGVAVVNRTFANHYFPGEDALGKQINFRDEQRWATIVGVVEDTRQAGLESDVRPEADLPYSQTRWQFLTATVSLAVRTDQDPISMSRAVEEAIRSVEPEQGVFAVSAMTSVIAQTETDKRFVMWLLALFAGLALVLAASGLFGQMSYAVTRRMHEIGLRIALGAERSDVLKLVLVDGVKLAALGLAIGLAASLTLTRLMASLLYAVKPAAPSVIVGAALLLAAVALLACYIPVRRATAVDPVAALRHE